MLKPSFYTEIIKEDSDYGKYKIEPLPQSFGQSLAHALRRTLLSSLSGIAITNVKLQGVSHIFTTIKGVKESVLEIILNLKQLRFKASGEGPFKIELSVKKEGKVYGKDIKGDVEIINKDLYICEVTAQRSKLEIEGIVEIGLGFSAIEEREEKQTGFIAVDAFFSPVKKVNFNVEETRVGRKTDMDCLVIEVWTDGSIKPSEALKKSSELLSNYFAYLLSGKDKKEQELEDDDEKSQKELIDQKLFEVIIDELNLPSRVINALLREKIETVADLVKVGKDKLKVMKGVGKKSIELINEELKNMGVSLDSN